MTKAEIWSYAAAANQLNAKDYQKPTKNQKMARKDCPTGFRWSMALLKP
jgi:hypothetical protein